MSFIYKSYLFVTMLLGV